MDFDELLNQTVLEKDKNVRNKGFCSSEKQFIELLTFLEKCCVEYKLEYCGDMPVDCAPFLTQRYKDVFKKMPLKIDRTTPKEAFDAIGMVDSPKKWNVETIFYVYVKAEIRIHPDEDEMSNFEKKVLQYYPTTIFLYIHRRWDEKEAHVIKLRQESMKDLTGTSFEEMKKSLEEEQKDF